MKKIREFECFIEKYKSTFELNYSDAVQVSGPPKQKRNITDPKVHFKRIFVEIIDNVLSECRYRYNSIKELKFFELLSTKIIRNIRILYQNAR